MPVKRDLMCIAIDDGRRCESQVFGRDLCSKHYQRQRRGETVETIAPAELARLEPRGRIGRPVSSIAQMMIRWKRYA